MGHTIYNESLYALIFMEEKLEVKEATEPSDLIWEDLQVDWLTIQKRQFATFIAIGAYLFLILVLFISMLGYVQR